MYHTSNDRWLICVLRRFFFRKTNAPVAKLNVLGILLGPPEYNFDVSRNCNSDFSDAKSPNGSGKNAPRPSDAAEKMMNPNRPSATTCLAKRTCPKTLRRSFRKMFTIFLHRVMCVLRDRKIESPSRIAI